MEKLSQREQRTETKVDETMNGSRSQIRSQNSYSVSTEKSFDFSTGNGVADNNDNGGRDSVSSNGSNVSMVSNASMASINATARGWNSASIYSTQPKYSGFKRVSAPKELLIKNIQIDYVIH